MVQSNHYSASSLVLVAEVWEDRNLMVQSVDELLAVDSEHAEHFSFGVHTRSTNCELLEAGLGDETHDRIDMLFPLLSNRFFVSCKAALIST